MTAPHDIESIRAVAWVIVRPDLSATELAASLGPATDLLGMGQHWIVEHPDIAGVRSVTVIGSPDRGPAGYPNAVLFGFRPGEGPRLHEVEAVLGTGTVIVPSDQWEPWRLLYEGPSAAQAFVTFDVSTDAVTGDEGDPLVTEIALRRTQR